MRLNRKGYLIVEIIVASVIAMTMMYFLMEITIKIKDINEDYYVRTKLETDKVLMTREFMKDINSMDVTEIDTSEGIIKFKFANGESKMIKLTTEDNKTKFQYGNANNSGYEFSSGSNIYTKTFDEKLDLSNIDISQASGAITLETPATNIYSDIDYGLELVIPDSHGICVNEAIKTDTSGANSPDLIDGMIPVVFNECSETWQKANETSGWYNYDEKKWANAVLVSGTNRDDYKVAPVGTKIEDSDILAHYVWIPRYKYKVWNIKKTAATDSYGAKENGIYIEFESGTDTTGTIKCNSYSYTYITATNNAGPVNETCSGSNGDFYTHPAFTFGADELSGIWVGKFEVSNSTSQIKIKPNVQSLRSTSVSNFFSAMQNMQKTNNSYGLVTDKTKVDSHMIKNMEWGAVAYFTHSKYGRCSSGCTEVSANTNSSYYTGGKDYINNIEQSTTGNVYGIYDMSGGSYEYVMGNMAVKNTNEYWPFEAGSGFSYSTSTAKYIDLYAYGGSNANQNAWNRAMLGDATGEVSVDPYKFWNDDYPYMAYENPDEAETFPWFRRGGRYSSVGAGIFSTDAGTGGAVGSFSTRAILVKIQ